MEFVKTYLLILFVLLLIIVIVGMLGNILSLAVWTFGKNCKKLHFRGYFKALAICDIIILIVPGFELLMLLPPFEIKLRALNTFFCKMLPYSLHSVVNLSAWITVCVAIEKMLCVAFPFKFTPSKSKLSRRIALTVVTIFWMGIGVIYLLEQNLFSLSDCVTHLNESTVNSASDELGIVNGNTSAVNMKCSSLFRNTTVGQGNNSTGEKGIFADGVADGENICYIAKESFLDKYSFEVEFIFSAMMHFIIPFAILIFCNIVILSGLARRPKLQEQAGGNSSLDKKFRQNQQFRTVLLNVVGISTLHCLSTAPICIMDSYAILGAKEELFELPVYFELTYLTGNILMYLNSSLNFAVYCFVGSTFRKDLKKLLRLS